MSKKNNLQRKNNLIQSHLSDSEYQAFVNICRAESVSLAEGVRLLIKNTAKKNGLWPQAEGGKNASA